MRTMAKKKQLKLSKIRDSALKTGDRKHVPLPTGDFLKIGCRDLMVGLSRKSGCLLRLYYPAENKQNEAMNPLLWPNWLPHEYYLQGYKDVVHVFPRLLHPLIEKMNKKTVFIPAIPNAKPFKLPKGKKFPVVVFSHGLGGCRTTYSAICTELASHGFVVAAVEHRDNSACLTFYPKRATYSFKSSNPDFFNIPQTDQVDADDEADFGDEIDDPNYVPPKALASLTNVPHLQLAWIRYRPVSIFRADDQVFSFRKRQVNHRVRECTRALDVIEALNAGYEINNLLDPGYNHREFEDALDMDKIIVMGHSFGGATALLAGAAELRFKVVVALDPWMFPLKDESLDLIPQPVVMIFTGNLARAPNTNSVLEWLNSPLPDGSGPDERKAVVIKGASHLQQSDSPYVFKPVNALKWLSIWDRIDSIKVHDLTTNLSLQFINQHLGVPISERVNRYLEEQKGHVKPLIK